MTSILQEAEEITGGDRRRDYGHPKVNHDNIAALWNAYCAGKGYAARFTAADAAMMQILVKVARHINTPKRDNLVDIAGYANCVALIDETTTASRNGLDGPAVIDQSAK